MVLDIVDSFFYAIEGDTGGYYKILGGEDTKEAHESQKIFPIEFG